MSSVQILSRQRGLPAGISMGSALVTLSSGGLAVASDSDVEVDSPLKCPEKADLQEIRSAGVPLEISKGRPSIDIQQQREPADFDAGILEIDGEPTQMSPAKLRAVENLSLPPRAAKPSKGPRGSKRRKNEGPESCRPRKRQPSRSSAARATAQLSAAVRAEEAGAIKAEAGAQEEGAVSIAAAQALKAEQAGPSKAPQQKQKPASAAASNLQGPSNAARGGKLKTARKTTGATQKVPAVKVKKEAAALAGRGVVGKVLPQAELAAALAGLKRAAPHQEMKHEPGQASFVQNAILYGALKKEFSLPFSLPSSNHAAESGSSMHKCRKGALPHFWDPGEREALRVSARGPDGESVPDEVLGGRPKGKWQVHISGIVWCLHGKHMGLPRWQEDIAP